jgi:Glycosyl hydrolase family 3 C terminal domain.
MARQSKCRGIDQVSAVLETYLAGETVGEATADVLYGDVNPSGKLAETFPLKLEDNPTFGTFGMDHDHERYHEGIYVGYRYYDVKQKNVLFPFGYGLSYTKFDYQNIRIRVTGNRVRVQFDVTNVGDRSGQAVAEIYVANQVSEVEKPIRELKNFDKVDLAPGETRTVTAILTDRDLSWYNQDQGRWQCDAGNYAIQIGTSSRNLVLSQVIKFTPIRQPHVQITENTYVGELQKYPELQSALIDSGLDAVIQRVTQESDSARLLENMPLRAGVMIGIDRAMVSRFLQLANQNNGYNG